MFGQVKTIRDIIICGEITEDLAKEVIEAINEINEENTNTINVEKIRLSITTVGGDVTAALAICNVIESSPTPIIGIANALVCSAGISILAACPERLGYARTVYMIHEISYCFEGKVEDAKDERKFIEILGQQMDEMIVTNTNIKQKELDKIYKRKGNYHFNSNKAKRWDLIERIL